MESTILRVHKSDTQKILNFAYIVTGDFAENIRYKSKVPRDIKHVFHSCLIPLTYPIQAPDVFILILDPDKHTYDELYGCFIYRPQEIELVTVKIPAGSNSRSSLYSIYLHIGIEWRTIVYSGHLFRNNIEVERTAVYDNEMAAIQMIASMHGDLIKEAFKDPDRGRVDSLFSNKLQQLLS